MSWQTHDDDCPGCRPTLADAKTMQPLSVDAPEMQALNRVWAATTLEERQAFHRVMCSNSRDQEDLGIVERLSNRLVKELT